jgi:Tfp pilus assembly protein PilF
VCSNISILWPADGPRHPAATAVIAHRHDTTNRFEQIWQVVMVRRKRAGRPDTPTSPAGTSAAVWIAAALIVAAGFWAYANSLDGTFVFDDHAAIVQNPNIRTLWPLATAMSAPRDITLSARPVASLTFAINYALAPLDSRDTFDRGRTDTSATAAERFERNVRGYHFLNLAIHLAAALALFGLVRRTLLSPRLRRRLGRAADGLSLATAIVWVVHPLHAEAVTYLVQRVESLAGLFVLLTLYCAIRAADRPHARLWSSCALASCALGLGTKEVAVAGPLLVIAWDWIFLTGDPATDERPSWWRRRWPLYAGLGATCLLLAFTEPGARSKSAGLWLDGWTPWTYLLTQAGVIVHYLRLAVWPSPLILDMYWPMARTLASVAAPFAALTVAVALSAVGVARRHALGFAGAWFFLLLAPTSSLLPIVTEVVAEHRMYLPLAAIIACAVVGSYLLGRALCEPAGDGVRRVAQVIGVVAVASAVIAFGLRTRARNLDYVSEEKIWRASIASQPDNPRARTALGAILVIDGRYDEAERELQKAVDLDPERAEALSNLGAAEFALGQLDSSVAHVERALALRPEYLDAHRNLAEAYLARGQHALAAPHFRRVLDAQPDRVVVLNHFGLMLAVSSDDAVRNGGMALELAERAICLTSGSDAASFTTKAAALAELDRFDEGVSVLREAIALSAGRPGVVAELERLVSSYQVRRKVRILAR